ncbi:WGR domain-containing protein [Halocynthiibacter styelae]|uniref:WGR domain-containing protein n=1 Tax=Halocynthiibacter styelae TaxID=2761955 RepID=A0A8J7ICV5_9RHOB|nr:WGR domain-containing protein [Paenihalocynthiibacter styelae]MBI1493798.1 WGR domain-containing protein [Paenihalocynthiibacter styelae]
MAVCFLQRAPTLKGGPRFYRIAIEGNLFGEWSVVFEWGICGCRGTRRIKLFNDLRAASLAADVSRNRMLSRGYDRA